MRQGMKKWFIAILVLTVSAAGPSWAAGGGEGSLTTAEFPDVVKFDFEKVHEHYEQAGATIGKVTPVIDAALAKGEAAAQAGEAAKTNPTDENKRAFVNAVVTFVRGGAESKTAIAEQWEEVRGIQTQTGILYAQGQAQTKTRIEELRKEFAREEMKYKERALANKARRKREKLNDWELRKLFDEEKRQAQVLTRIADRIAFQEDFAKALDKAAEDSTGDFTLYDQFFAEAVESFSDIGDLASNLPLVVDRLQISAALAKNIPSRKAAAQGFEKIERTKKITQQIAAQLMDVCAGDLTPTTPDEERVIIRHTQTYTKWVEGENVDYRRPPKASK